MSAVLTARDLRVRLPDGTAAVDGVDLDVRPGRLLALVGTSGAGKSLTVRALARLLPPGLAATGRVELDGQDLLALPGRRLRALRGTRLGWVGQDATASLNPTVTVGTHLSETVHAQGRRRGRALRVGEPGRGPRRGAATPGASARSSGLAALASAGLPDPDALWDAYPFELSGGQAQRVAIALAVVAEPAVLLADEVTSALDVVSQAEVMGLLRAQAEAGRAVLVVTHDLRAAARHADDVVVLDAGHVVERGSVTEVLAAPATALTRAWAGAGTAGRP